MILENQHVRLKNLEMQGFKTFASRTEFAFAGAITAIVGPNGSGKSNVADAIRWVLGEQSYSLLRAKKTDDMIFSGSEQRARAGMAQATIVFDNSDGWLPIDFSEVAITRRAYRDGQNEYFINSQKVRLKDVTELLAQSGLSERTYTIIGQGLVDAALSLKAEERRRLFEEAAGIGLYRSRREEALRRLESTKRNLERVEDILAELQPRLRSLEKQARRFQEYEQVKADLNLILRDWYGYHWHRSQHDLLDAQNGASGQEYNLTRARENQLELDRKMNFLRSQIQNQREVVNALHRQMSELHNQRERTGRELIILDERTRSLLSQQQTSQYELNRFADEQNLEQEWLEEAQAEEGQLALELEETSNQLSTVQQAFETRQLERALAEKTVKDMQQSLGILTNRQMQLKARLIERKVQAERRQALIREARENLLVSEKSLINLEHSFELSTKKQNEYEAGRLAAENALQAHLSQQAKLESEYKKVGESRVEIATSLTRLQAHLDVLEQAERNLIGYASGARLLLQAAQQSRLDGAAGIFSSRLEVPPDFETAIAAALGEYLDAVVVNEREGLEDALNILSDHPARGVILPLSLIHYASTPLNEDWKVGLPGIIDFADNLVRTTKEFQPIVSMLLGKTLVVDNRRVARSVITRWHSYGYEGKVVTLRGEVFFTTGPVIAGVEGKPGKLSRVRERKELQMKLNQQDQQKEEIEGRLGEISKQLKLVLAQELILRENLKQAVENEKLAYSTQIQNGLAVEKARRSMIWYKEQTERLMGEENIGEAETGMLTEELSKINEGINIGQEKLRLANANLESLSLDELQAQLAHWNTHAAVIQQAFSDAQKRKSERQNSLERSARNENMMRQRLIEIEEQLQTTASAKEATSIAEKQVNTEVDKLHDVVLPVEETLDILDQQYTRLQAAESESRQVLSLAEHQNAQAKINLVRRQEALENLRRRIEEDFGLVAFKYAESISGPTPLPIEGMVEYLPVLNEIPVDLEENIKRQRAQLRRIGPVNSEAHSEYIQVKERYEFLTSQVEDLKRAENGIHEVIAELDSLMEREFRKTFDAVAREFRHTFSRLFNGGNARLVLTTPEDMAETGIDIEARLPGRREQGLSLLSGGERSLTATALVFSLLKVSPTPFCLLDEVDAMLDEANVSRFRELLRELSQNTQFVVVTHNRNTVQAADVIYGVTMGADSTSQVISLKLDELSQVVN